MLQNVTLELVTIGDLKLVEHPSPEVMGPFDFCSILTHEDKIDKKINVLKSTKKFQMKKVCYISHLSRYVHNTSLSICLQNLITTHYGNSQESNDEKISNF